LVESGYGEVEGKGIVITGGASGLGLASVEITV
jgi:NAD(P)-dependent dehydrogenase (short-subunit alcohol dehydrogenase family)